MKRLLFSFVLLSAPLAAPSAQADHCVAAVKPRRVQAVLVPQYEVHTFFLPYAPELALVLPPADSAQQDPHSEGVRRAKSLQAPYSPAQGAAAVVIERRGIFGRRKILIRP